MHRTVGLYKGLYPSYGKGRVDNLHINSPMKHSDTVSGRFGYRKMGYGEGSELYRQGSGWTVRDVPVTHLHLYSVC